MNNYQLVIVPSSEDEELFRDVKNFEDAYNLSNKAGNVADYFSFKTKEEREIFIQGYRAGVGYLGSGMFFENDFHEEEDSDEMEPKEKIAQFMDLAKQDATNDGGNIFLYEHPRTGMYVYPEDLEYDRDISMAMSVLEKISGLTDEDGNFLYTYNLSPEQITIQNYGFEELANNSHGGNMPEMIYHALVDFFESISDMK